MKPAHHKASGPWPCYELESIDELAAVMAAVDVAVVSDAKPVKVTAEAIDAVQAAFTLRQTDRKPARPTTDIPVPPKRRQAVLFSGMGCCPGQRDLFDTDGTAKPQEDH